MSIHFQSLQARVFQGVVRYEGLRKRTRVILQRRMYQDEIPGWLEEADQEHQDSPGLPVPQHTSDFRTESLPISTPPSHSTPQQTPPSYYGTLNPSISVDSNQRYDI